MFEDARSWSLALQPNSSHFMARFLQSANSIGSEEGIPATPGSHLSSPGAQLLCKLLKYREGVGNMPTHDLTGITGTWRDGSWSVAMGRHGLFRKDRQCGVVAADQEELGKESQTFMRSFPWQTLQLWLVLSPKT